MRKPVVSDSALVRGLDRVWRLFASVKLTIALLVLLAAAMAYGTYVETTLSNGAARILVYRTWWFDGLIVLLAMNLIGCTLRRAPYKIHQIGWITTHIALLIIMAASIVTHRFSQHGQMIVTEGEANDIFLLEALDRDKLEMVNGAPRRLPFAVYCYSFDQIFYPNSGQTRMFRSRVAVFDPAAMDTLRHDVILNHPLVYGGYKISQSSWIDLKDGRQATVLGVAYDPGIPLMYVGGVLLILGMAGIFFLKPYLKQKFPARAARSGAPPAATLDVPAASERAA